MVPIILVVSVLALAILVTHLALAVGVVRNRRRDLRAPAPSPHTVSVSLLVVSRDEEAVLPGLLDSLEKQTAEGFEIVLVDDRSTDGTYRILEEYARRTRREVRVIRNDRDPVGVTGKVQALDLAVGAARGEILLFTDADCVLPPDWVREHVAYYRDPAVGGVFGQVNMVSNGSILHAFQSFDQRLIHQYSSGSAGLGLPTGCFGNNLSVRREAVLAVGGFRGLGYTTTEDAALISAVGARSWRIVAATSAATTITTRPQASWGEFVNQHTRWNVGGFYSADRTTRMTYRFLVLYLTLSILAAPFGLLAPLLVLPAVNSLISVGILALTEAWLYPVRTRKDRLVAIPLTLLFLLFYSWITILAVFRKRPVWKGAVLDAGP